MTKTERQHTAGTPRWIPAFLAAPEGRESGPDNAQQGLRVLIVEDDFLIAMSIGDVVRQAGHQVAGIASSAEEAVRLSRIENPDFATMDIRLREGENGIDTARALYSEHGVRCLFVSAFSGAGNRRGTEECRPLGWISKPFSSEQLAAALKFAANRLKRH